MAKSSRKYLLNGYFVAVAAHGARTDRFLPVNQRCENANQGFKNVSDRNHAGAMIDIMKALKYLAYI